jgi:hypothetical protein
MRRVGTVKLGILTGMLVGAALTCTMHAQAPGKLKVEVGPNQQISIVASDVTYGEVLRALQGKLGCEIEIPHLADEKKLSYVSVEATGPQDALAQLLAGSKLGYAVLGGSGARILKVIVTSATADEAGDAVSSTPVDDTAKAETSSLPSAQAEDVSAIQQPDPPRRMPLSEAINDMGTPAGVSPADVGRMTTFPMSNAAAIMGVPPGLGSGDVGRAMNIPISEAATIMGVPPGTSPDSVGKTITLPLPTGPGQHP